LELISFVWNQILISPAINFMIVLSRLLFGSFGLAIIVFTLVLRLVTLPLTLRQLNSSKKMQVLQPKLQEIQKKYSDPKRRSEETMKLYKTEGVNPAGCLLPTLIQFPIWIALYQVIRITLGATPESLIDLSHRLYPWAFIQQSVPLAAHFLWLNLGAPDTTLVMPILVFVTMWVQQKLTMSQATMTPNSQTAQTNQMMLWFMPILFAYFSLNLPSGLALYWVVTNIAGIALNYSVYDWHGKPLIEILGFKNFSLKSLGGIFLPRPRTTVPAARSQPQRGRGTTNPASGGRGSTDPINGRADDTGTVPTPLTNRNGVPGGRNRRQNAPQQRKTQPKAPPVVRRVPPTTGRLGTDSAGNDGGAETRSGDGRGS
jgi:YidC/Oxa1 family membrane protein insertase